MPPGIPKPETDQSIARLGSRIPDQAWALEHKGWQRMMKKSNSHCRRFTLTPYFGGLQLELASDSRHVTKRVLHPYIGPCKKSSSEHLRDDSFAYLSGNAICGAGVPVSLGFSLNYTSHDRDQISPSPSLIPTGKRNSSSAGSACTKGQAVVTPGISQVMRNEDDMRSRGGLAARLDCSSENNWHPERVAKTRYHMPSAR